MADDLDSSELTKVFINNVDTYSSGAIGKILSSTVIGGTVDDEADDASLNGSLFVKGDCYVIVGTMKDDTKSKPSWVKEIYEYDTKEDLLGRLLLCDIIIYNIASDINQVEEATWVVSVLNAEIQKFKSQKIFICVSTVLTWAKTKPVDPTDVEMPFTDEDYRKRKAHPNFKSHLTCEKLTIKYGKKRKSKLMTYVVCAGLPYGAGEDIFHFLFKTAWIGKENHLPIFGNGQNILPMIHINDLAHVVVNICDQKPKIRYILAVDESKATLEEVVRAIARNLGNDRVKLVSKEDALLDRSMTQLNFDHLLVNLRMDAAFIKESMRISWKCEGGMLENIHKVIRGYKERRNLLPLRVCILGPPASGKTTVSKQLCEHYKIHHLRIQDVIDEAIIDLKVSSARANVDGDDEDDDVVAQDSQKMLDDIAQCRLINNGRLDDEFIVQFYKERLHSMPCQNQGYILDGFPKTMEQAKKLFSVDNDEELGNEDNADYDTTIMPEYLISLNACDDFLRKRVMQLPESVVSGTHNTEEGLGRRLSEFRPLNTDDETVMNFFDELEIHPEHIDITQDLTPQMRQTVERIQNVIGKGRNYGPTVEELRELKRIGIEIELSEIRRKQDEMDRLQAEEARERAKKLEEWRSRLNDVKQEELQMLEVKSIPLRNYLMKHVMPTLTQGLIECCKLRPDDPVDFLAEYLFEVNPQTNL